MIWQESLFACRRAYFVKDAHRKDQKSEPTTGEDTSNWLGNAKKSLQSVEAAATLGTSALHSAASQKT